MTAPLYARQEGDLRFYSRHGVDHLSVTTALSALPKDGLPVWAARETATLAARIIEGKVPCDLRGDDLIKYLKAEPIRQRDEAARIGDEAHEHFEHIMNLNNGGWSFEIDDYVDGIADADVQKRVVQFLKWLNAHKVRPLYTEATIYNEQYGYAGSCDLIADIDGLVTLVDYKTSKGIYGSVALQAVAYANGEYILTSDGREESLPRIQRAAVLHVRPRSYKFREVDISAPRFIDFLRTLDQKREWVMRAEGRALGPEIPPIYAE